MEMLENVPYIEWKQAFYNIYLLVLLHSLDLQKRILPFFYNFLNI